MVDNKDFLKSLDDYYFYIGEKLLISGIKLSEITEEQASEILEDYHENNFHLNSSIESLHSLLQSKGIHLFSNPFNIENCFEPNYYEKKLKAEQKTFYNPYIFKL